MSSGFIELAAIGQQDIYLTGSPQVTYFAGKYNQHTPFVLESYEIPFKTRNLQFGDSAVCEIPPKGDLIRGLTLKLDLPGLYTPTINWTWPILPSAQNDPTLWFGLSNGTISGPFSAPFNLAYYSTDTFSAWNPSSNISYSSSQNRFVFTGISNVIVQNTTGSAGPLFWGLDPTEYTFKSGSNLIYSADVSGNLVSNFTLELSGWVNRSPAVPPSQTQVFLNLNQWSQTGTPGVLSNGMYQFPATGYYIVQLGISLSNGSVHYVSYGSQASSVLPPSPTFSWTYTLASSVNPSTQIILPIVVTDPTQYYYFYLSTGGTPTTIINGTFLVIEQTNLILEFPSISYIVAPYVPPPYPQVIPGSPIPFPSPSLLPSTITYDSINNTFSNVTDMCLVSGVIQFAQTDPPTDTRITFIQVMKNYTEIWYIIDVSAVQIDPTWAFSFPIFEANSTDVFSIVLFTNGGIIPAYYGHGTFLSIKLIQGITVTGAGFILSSGFVNLTTFNQYSASVSNVITNGDGSFGFTNPGTYMISAIFTNLPTMGITNPNITFAGYQYDISTWLQNSYVFSFPVVITDTTQHYGMYFNGIPATTLGVSAFITVYQIAGANSPSSVLFPPYTYCDSVGTFAIVSAELRIGGQTIQTLTGEYIELWNELNVPLENQAGLKLLTGKYDTNTSVAVPGRTYYVNLPFYFYGAPELSLPICALEKHNVEVWVTFNQFQNLTNVQVTNPKLSATIITEYVYLAEPELNWFKSRRLDYVITQSQYQTFVLFPNQSKHILELNFIQPTKELFFVIQNQGTAPYDFSNNGLQSMGLTFNGQDVFLADPTDALYLGTIEPMNHHINFFSTPPGSTIPGRQFFMYSFSTDPNSPNPSGQINLSRIRQILLEVNEIPPGPNQTLRVVAVSQNVLRVENGLGGIMFN